MLPSARSTTLSIASRRGLTRLNPSRPTVGATRDGSRRFMRSSSLSNPTEVVGGWKSTTILYSTAAAVAIFANIARLDAKASLENCKELEDKVKKQNEANWDKFTLCAIKEDDFAMFDPDEEIEKDDPVAFFIDDDLKASDDDDDEDEDEDEDDVDATHERAEAQGATADAALPDSALPDDQTEDDSAEVGSSSEDTSPKDASVEAASHNDDSAGADEEN